MYYSYIEIEYVATSFTPTRTDLALKLLTAWATYFEGLSPHATTPFGSLVCFSAEVNVWVTHQTRFQKQVAIDLFHN
jgi:hypothetical protein